LKTFRFNSTAYHCELDLSSSLAGGESYSAKRHCQPRLDQQPASSSEHPNPDPNIQLIDSQGVFSSSALELGRIIGEQKLLSNFLLLSYQKKA
jgi:hypothetical protein